MSAGIMYEDDERRATVRGREVDIFNKAKKKLITVYLAPLAPLPTATSKALKAVGKDPADYRSAPGGVALPRCMWPAWQAAVDAAEAERRAKAEALARNVPGLEELREVYAEEDAYRHAFNRMMADEQNDGVRPPRKPARSGAEVAARYPRAAVYLKAECYAAHDMKVSAGKRACELLAAGGSVEDATAILEGWVGNVSID